MALYETTKSIHTVWATGSIDNYYASAYRGGIIPLLLVGSALDGPANTLTRVTSMARVEDVFGGYRYDRWDIDSATSGLTLSGTVNATGSVIQAYKYVNNELVSLFIQNLKVETSGGLVSFKPLGADGSGSVIFKYRPAEDSSSLVRGYREASIGLESPEMYLLRLARPAATGTFGNLDLVAKYPGARYNGTQVIISTAGTGITFVIPPGLAANQTISYTVPVGSTLTDLIEEINRDTTLGRNVVIARVDEPHASAISSTTSGVLDGGSDSPAKIAEIAYTLANSPLDAIKTCCILGIDAQDFHTVIETEVIDADRTGPPTLFVLSARPMVAGETTGNYVSEFMVSGALWDSSFISVVASECEFLGGSPNAYYGNAAPLYAGVVAREPFTTSQKRTNVVDFRPIYNKVQLDQMEASGLVTLNRSISRDVVVRRGVTTSNKWSLGTIKALQEVYTRIYLAFSSYIGENLITIGDINTALAAILYTIPFLEEITFDTAWDGKTLSITVNLRVYGEIKSVTTQIVLQPRNILPT